MAELSPQLQHEFDIVVRRNPGEAEFHQAVREVLESLSPVMAKRPEYVEFGIIPDFVQASIEGIGNGSLSGAYATLLSRKKREEAADIAREALNIAADICVYTNHNIKVEELE